MSGKEPKKKNKAGRKDKDSPENFAFIDAQNLYLGMKELGWSLDYKRFRVYLEEKYDVSVAYLFIGYIATNQDLYTSLQEAGYVLKFKPVLPASSGRDQKGDVDADLVLNIMRHYSTYKKAVIITSDGDFDTTVKFLEKKDKLRSVISPTRRKCSVLLRRAAGSKIDYIDNLRGKLEYKKR